MSTFNGTTPRRSPPKRVAGNLNLLEFTREDVRWQRPHTILEESGVLLFAGVFGLPRGTTTGCTGPTTPVPGDGGHRSCG